MKNRYLSFSRRLSQRLLIVFLLTITVVSVLIISLATIGVRSMANAYFLAELQIANEAIEKKVAEGASTNSIYKRLRIVDAKINEFYPLVSKGANEVDNKDVWAYSIIIDSVGNYIVHPDKQHMQKGNFFNDISQSSDTLRKELTQGLASGKKSMQAITVDGVSSYIFYTKVKGTKWRNAIILPRNGMQKPTLITGLVLLIIIGVGLLAAYTISRITIRRSTWPLHQLAKSADEVAKGNFLAKLPEIKHNDEISQLRDSFRNMQQSLEHYIEDLKVSTAEKASIESELKVAHNIQMAMLPKTFPPFPESNDVEIHGMLKPAKAVGGDLYDFVVCNKKLFFCIGDVSGKGVPASLVMAVTKALFRNVASHIADHSGNPSHIVERINSSICEANDNCMFVTLFVGVLDLQTGHLRYCNAGHDSPYIGGTLLPCDSNIPVGVMSDWNFTEQEADLATDEIIFLYTDGLTEAENARHELFGEKRITAIVASHKGSPQELIEVMNAAVHEFVGDIEQSDDLTMLAIQKK